jgi:hypothetical protein
VLAIRLGLPVSFQTLKLVLPSYLVRSTFEKMRSDSHGETGKVARILSIVQIFTKCRFAIIINSHILEITKLMDKNRFSNC